MQGIFFSRVRARVCVGKTKSEFFEFLNFSRPYREWGHSKDDEILALYCFSFLITFENRRILL